MAGEHLPSDEQLAAWPAFTAEDPLAILVSGCLLGRRCGVDGSSYGAPYDHLERLLAMPNVRAVGFCPEDAAFGTPRETPDIHGGTGVDVLDGRARVLSESGQDWTVAMVGAAHSMLDLAIEQGVRLALLMDISAACGSQVIYRGFRREGAHQPGQGVAAALLVRHGIPVVSQRDHRSLGRVLEVLDPAYRRPAGAIDHHESEWYRTHFGGPG